MLDIVSNIVEGVNFVFPFKELFCSCEHLVFLQISLNYLRLFLSFVMEDPELHLL